MADQQKGKNRAAILQELESIKGLLVDEDDIPVLQEVIDSAEAQLDNGESLDDEDLLELQQAYRDLIQAHEEEESGDDQDVAHEAPAVPTPEHKSSAGEAPVRTEVQTSLFDTDLNYPEDHTDAPLDDSIQEAPSPEPALKKSTASETRSSASRRPGVTKATGENPFLPAHIRARLHGNRPPPLFEPLTPSPTPVKAVSKFSDTGDRVKRAQLTDELVAEFLPQIEAALRERLQAMTEEQIQQLASKDTHSEEKISPDDEHEED